MALVGVSSSTVSPRVVPSPPQVSLLRPGLCPGLCRERGVFGEDLGALKCSMKILADGKQEHIRPIVSSAILTSGVNVSALQEGSDGGDIREHIQSNKICSNVIRIDKFDSLDHPIDGHARRSTPSAEKHHDLQLFLPWRGHAPRQGYRNDEDDNIADDCKRYVRQEQLPLVETSSVDSGVPICSNGRADADFQNLDRYISHDEKDDEQVDAARDPCADSEYSSDEK